MRRLLLLALLLLPLVATSCKVGLRIAPIDPQVAYVGELFRLPVEVASDDPYTLWFEAPDLPSLGRWAELVERPSGGELQWTPQVDHVGPHVFTFIADTGAERAEREVVITVEAAREGAPVFLAPPPVVVVDLARQPCAEVPVEVRDLDTPQPTVRVVTGLPAGATLDDEGSGRATLRWCPAPDQAAAAAQWVIALEADDRDHDPVRRDVRVLLAADAKAGCEGEPPIVSWLFPGEGEWVTSFVGYDVELEVTSATPLRDPPVLLYTTGRVDPRERVDFEAFAARAFEWTGAHWQAHIPSLVLAEDERQTLTLLAWVTDNADPRGTRCDRRAELRARRFVAVGAIEAGVLPDCAPCAQSGDCASGVCLSTPTGARCVPACLPEGGRCAAGECRRWNGAEGVVRWACGDVPAVCDGVGACIDDRLENNDEPAAATPLASGELEAVLCEGDPDIYGMGFSRPSRVRVEARPEGSGDVEVRVLDRFGSIVAVSGGEGDEAVETCAQASEELLAEVLSPRGERIAYSLSLEAEDEACACLDDAGEPDGLDAPRSLPRGTVQTGRVCPGNTDYYAIEGAPDARTRLTLEVTGPPADLDLDLLAPDGRLVGASRGTGGSEQIERDLDGPGPYVLRVFGFDASATDYRLTHEQQPLDPCLDAGQCAADEACLDGLCRRRACASNADCAEGTLCPRLSLEGERSCVTACVGQGDCPDGWDCKRFAEGSACAPDGPGETGAVCASATDCAGARGCLDWPGGYCAEAGCEVAWGCGNGDVCAVVDGRPICVRDCWVSDDLCDRGEPYVCEELVAPDGDLVLGCYPETR